MAKFTGAFLIASAHARKYGTTTTTPPTEAKLSDKPAKCLDSPPTNESCTGFSKLPRGYYYFDSEENKCIKVTLSGRCNARDTKNRFSSLGECEKTCAGQNALEEIEDKLRAAAEIADEKLDKMRDDEISISEVEEKIKDETDEESLIAEEELKASLEEDLKNDMEVAKIKQMEADAILEEEENMLMNKVAPSTEANPTTEPKLSDKPAKCLDSPPTNESCTGFSKLPREYYYFDSEENKCIKVTLSGRCNARNTKNRFSSLGKCEKKCVGQNALEEIEDKLNDAAEIAEEKINVMRNDEKSISEVEEMIKDETDEENLIAEEELKASLEEDLKNDKEVAMVKQMEADAILEEEENMLMKKSEH